MNILKTVQTLRFDAVHSLLSSAPYNLKVKSSLLHPSLYLLTYDMIHSDFSHPIVCESRGAILEKHTNRLICLPFEKFWNHGEGRAASIEWETARVQEKLDGSLMKVYWYDGEAQWIVATNGMVDAKEASIGDQGRTFYELFMECWRVTRGQMAEGEEVKWDEVLHRDHVYLFEMMHPESVIVVQHQQPRLCHLATRNMKTLQEAPDMDVKGVPRPREYALKSLDDCLAAARQLTGYDNEGFVVVDAQFRRVKIKSVAYVTAHHARTNVIDKDVFLMRTLLEGEQEEVMAYFPDLTERLHELDQKFKVFMDKLTMDVLELVSSVANEPDERIRQKQMAIQAKMKHGNLFGMVMRAINVVKGMNDEKRNDQEVVNRKLRDMLFDAYMTDAKKTKALFATVISNDHQE